MAEIADGGVEAEVAHVGALAEASLSRGELLDCCHDERQKLRGMVLALDQKDAGAGGQKKSGKKRKGTAVKKAPGVP